MTNWHTPNAFRYRFYCMPQWGEKKVDKKWQIFSVLMMTAPNFYQSQIQTNVSRLSKDSTQKTYLFGDISFSFLMRKKSNISIFDALSHDRKFFTFIQFCDRSGHFHFFFSSSWLSTCQSIWMVTHFSLLLLSLWWQRKTAKTNFTSHWTSVCVVSNHLFWR